MSSTDVIREMLAEGRWLHYRERDRIVQVSGSAEVAIRIVTRVIPAVPTESLDQLKTYLNTYASGGNTVASSTIASPMVDGRALAGTWTHGQVYLQQERLPNQQIETWNIYQTIWQSGSATLDYFDSEHTCRYTAELSIIWGTSSPPTLPDAAAGVTYRIVSRDQDPDTGSWEWVVERRTRQYQGPDPYTSEINSAYSEETTEQLGVVAGRDTVAGITNEVGKLKTQRVTANEDCSKDAVTQVRTAIDQPGSGVDERADQSSAIETHTQADAEADGSAVAGYVVRTENAPTEYGKFRTRREVITPIDQPGEEEEARADQTSTTETHTQADAQADGDAIAGKVVRASSAPTEFGKYRTRREVVTPIDQPGQGAEARADQTASIETHTQSDAAADETPVAGQIIDAESVPTEFGKYRTRRRVVTPIDQSGTEVESRADQSSSTETHTQSDSAADGAAVTGKIIRAASAPTEFGKYRTRREEVTPVDQTGQGAEIRADQTAAIVTHTQSETVADETADAGTIVDAESSPTEFGKFRTRRRVITPVDQTGSEDEARADQTTSIVTHTQSTSVADGSAIAGKIVRATSAPTEFGKYRTRRELITPVDQAGQGAEARADQTTSIETHTQSDSVADEAAIAGKIVDAESVPTEFGKYRTRRRVVTPTFVSTGWLEYTDRYGTSYVIGFVNASEADLTTIKSAMTSVTNNQLSASKNEFGLYDGSGSRVASNDSSSGASEDWDTGFDFTVPECAKHASYNLFKAYINYTSSKSKAQTHINTSQGYGTLVDYGAGEQTGIRALGRGRYRACRVEGKA